MELIEVGQGTYINMSFVETIRSDAAAAAGDERVEVIFSGKDVPLVLTGNGAVKILEYLVIKGSSHKGDHVLLGHAPRTVSFAKELPDKKKAWRYVESQDGRGKFVALVNLFGSCSRRVYDAQTGQRIGPRQPERRRGNFQDEFEDDFKYGKPMWVTRQPNLERDCSDRLPAEILNTLKAQVESK